MTKKSKQIKCKFCGCKTTHFLTSQGEYKCSTCGSTNKTIAMKDIVFEPEFDLDTDKEEPQEEVTLCQEEVSE